MKNENPREMALKLEKIAIKSYVYFEKSQRFEDHQEAAKTTEIQFASCSPLLFGRTISKDLVFLCVVFIILLLVFFFG